MMLPIQKEIEGKYEILEKIGEGGIGSVYKVKHRLLEEVRVIKVLRPQVAAQEDLQQRFLHEAKMAIRLKHQNIAQLHDFAATEDGTAYIVMEFIDGVPVDAMLETSGAPSVDLAIEISRQALGALEYLHHHKFVHRDISPDNLMLASSFDGKPLVKLIDLGIAKNLEAQAQLTQTGVFLGKVRYSSPEQFSGQSGTDLDHRSDIYSYGVMLYELLTGEYPFQGESFTELAGNHLFQAPRDFDETDPESKLHDGLRQAVLRALEKEPDKRYDSAQDFADELEKFRDPSHSFDEEVGRTVETTASALPSLEGSRAPGSTQNRLNEEFGMVTTPSPRHMSEITDAETTAKGVESTILATTIGDGSKSASGTGSGRRWTLFAFGAIGGLILLAAVGWFFFRGAETSSGVATTDPSSADSALVRVQPTVRWDPTQINSSEGDLLLDQGSAPDLASEETDDAADSPEEPSDSSAPDGIDTEPPSAGPVEEEEQEVSPSPAAQTTSEIFTTGVGVVPPVLLSLPEPEFPDSKGPKNEIVIMVHVLVDEHGKVLTATVKKGPSFRRKVKEAALAAARGARFRPAVRDGVNGRMRTDVRVVFSPE